MVIYFDSVQKSNSGSGGIRTHASEETGALNQRLRPLGHATLVNLIVLHTVAYVLFLYKTYNSLTTLCHNLKMKKKNHLPINKKGNCPR